MADIPLFERVQKLRAVCIFAGDIVPTTETECEGVGWCSTRGLEADKTGPVFSYERVLAAAALYRMNPSLVIVPSGGCTNVDGKKSPPISSVIAFELEQLGVPQVSVVEEPFASNTYDQIVRCAAIAREKQWPAYQVAILAPCWQFARVTAMIGNMQDIEPFENGITYLVSMERALAAEDDLWNARFAEWYASPVARDMFAKEALGTGQLWAGHQPLYPKPFRGFGDPLAQ